MRIKGQTREPTRTTSTGVGASHANEQTAGQRDEREQWSLHWSLPSGSQQWHAQLQSSAVQRDERHLRWHRDAQITAQKNGRWLCGCARQTAAVG